MLLVYAEGPAAASDREHVRAHLPADQPVRFARDWDEFLSVVPRSGCLVLVAVELTENMVRRVRDLRWAFPVLPVVLVTGWDPDNALRLLGLPADGVVWRHRVHRELWTRVCAARAGSLMERVATAVEAARHLPPPLRHTMSRALRMVPPPNSVQALCDLGGCHRSTVAAYWSAARTDEGGPPVRLQDFVAWLMILHAAGRKPRHQKWEAVAADCGVHLHTLRRSCVRLAGLRLPQIEAGGREDLLATFAKRVLAPLGVEVTFAPRRPSVHESADRAVATGAVTADVTREPSHIVY